MSIALAGVVLGGWACYKLGDQGLANALGLETLRHGTSPINYLGIKLFGGMPSAGGSRRGGTNGWHTDNTSGKFYVFKDSEMPARGRPAIRKRMLPNLYKYLAGHNSALTLTCLPPALNTQYFSLQVLSVVIGVIGGITSVILTPTLKFRITPKEISEKYTNDPSCRDNAYYTTHYVGMWKIGLIGTLTQGLNFGIFQRIINNPAKAATGVAQIAAAVALVALGITFAPAALPLAAPYAVPIATSLILFA